VLFGHGAEIPDPLGELRNLLRHKELQPSD
jgi:hypothetical protein